LNRQTYVQSQLGTSAPSYEAQGYRIWAENYLGLHNKPKAAVRAGAFMWTGPREGGAEEEDDDPFSISCVTVLPFQ
jgi:hypothetical protein